MTRPGPLRFDLDPVGDRALAREGWASRLALLGAVLVLALVVVGAAAVRNPGRELGPVEGPPPIAAYLGVRLEVPPPSAVPAAPSAGAVVETFDGPLSGWRADGSLTAEGGELVASGPGRLLVAGAVPVAAVEVELLPGTPEAGIVVGTSGDEWTWTAGPGGLRLVRTVDGVASLLWSGPGEGGAPRLGVRLGADGLDLEVGGRVVLRVEGTVPGPGASLVGLVVVGTPFTPTPVTTRATLTP